MAERVKCNPIQLRCLHRLLKHFGIRYMTVTATCRKNKFAFFVNNRQIKYIQCSTTNGAHLLASFRIR